MYIMVGSDARVSLSAYYSYLREASARLLVLLYRAIPEPLCVERANSIGFTLFFFRTTKMLCWKSAKHLIIIMKKFLVCLFALVAMSASAKDVIMLSDGQTIDAKVLSIGSSEISYKRADNPNGPTYVIPTAKVFYIAYENGQKEVINDLSKPATTQAGQSSLAAEALKEKNKKAIYEEDERIEMMGNNNLRIRLGFGGQFGEWTPKGSDEGADFTGGSVPEFDCMWLHSIFDYTGNIGIGLGCNNLLGDVGDISISATYITMPLQLQYVDKSGFTAAGIVTPAFLMFSSGSYGSYDLDDSSFSSFRCGIGLEIGYNYRRWDFGFRSTLWIGNVLKGLSSSVDYNFGLSVGYRIKLN